MKEQNEFEVMFINLSSVCCFLTDQQRNNCYNKHCRLKIAGRIIDAIDVANTSIRVAMYIFSYDPFHQALIRAHRRGVTVRVFVDERLILKNSMSHLESAGIAVRYFQRLNQSQGLDTDFIMHHKFCIIDGAQHGDNDVDGDGSGLFIGGSLNWSNNSLTKNCENVLFAHKSKIIQLYKTEFDLLWEATQQLPAVVGY